MTRIYNFSSGPAMLPEPVLEQARDEMLSVNGSGMSVMEISHRSKLFGSILAGAEQGLRDVLDIPANYKVLFMQGGATAQFALIPSNFLNSGLGADYVVTGYWGKKAAAAAGSHGNVNIVADTGSNGFRTIPDPAELTFSPDAAYVHYTSNETIDGVEFKYDLGAGGLPVICDACSNILSKPIDISKYTMIYAGAQKNIGPSGVTVVIIRDDMLERVAAGLPPLFDYRTMAEQHSMVNTPNTWGVYLIGLVCGWIKDQGGLAALKIRNEEKARLLYNAIDSSDGFYTGRAERPARSAMNVTFTLPTADLERKFCKEAERRQMSGLAGHRSVGGIRASIYNAFPLAGVEALVEFMSDFSAENS
ncbi:MAG: 3-phosphoserine/phosphohydroxythreonine transaminase [Pyrinomonadaceae bacterium]